MAMEKSEQTEVHSIEEPPFTTSELARTYNLHPATIRGLFRDEPGVIRFGHPSGRGRGRYFRLRIPRPIARRVFSRLTVGGGDPAAA
jgi:hypothetical protein